MKRQLKKSVVYGLYATSFVLLVAGVAILGVISKEVTEPEYQYVSKGILDYEEEIKVVNTEETISRPYLDVSVNIVKSYYDYKAEASSQEQSLIYYEDTYMQSSGIAYSNGETFDVIAVYNGIVTDVKEDSILGNVVTIEHENGIISVYQSITEITVKTGDTVTRGQTIAKSSTSNISTDLGNHLYFELIIDGECVNAENYYNKSINEI